MLSVIPPSLLGLLTAHNRNTFKPGSLISRDGGIMAQIKNLYGSKLKDPWDHRWFDYFGPNFDLHPEILKYKSMDWFKGKITGKPHI